MIDKSVTFTEQELCELCSEWQETLKLQDWEVGLAIAREIDFKRQVQAECSWVLPKKMALIKIIDPIDYHNEVFLQDMEVSLVHELLHLHYAPFDNFDNESLECVCMEQSIDLIAKALVKLKRNSKV